MYCREVTDAGLANLKSLPKLKELTLYENDKVTDAGLAAPKDFPALTRLDFRHTKVTDAGVKTFQTARPRVAVER